MHRLGEDNHLRYYPACTPYHLFRIPLVRIPSSPRLSWHLSVLSKPYHSCCYAVWVENLYYVDVELSGIGSPTMNLPNLNETRDLSTIPAPSSQELKLLHFHLPLTTGGTGHKPGFITCLFQYCNPTPMANAIHPSYVSSMNQDPNIFFQATPPPITHTTQT